MTTKDVSRATRATIRQLQVWCETGLFDVPIVGHERAWPESELRAVMLTIDLRRAGVSLQRVRTILKAFRKSGGEKPWLVVTARSVFFYFDAESAATAACSFLGQVVMVQLRRARAVESAPVSPSARERHHTAAAEQSRVARGLVFPRLNRRTVSRRMLEPSETPSETFNKLLAPEGL